jgi:hypothetical protein
MPSSYCRTAAWLALVIGVCLVVAGSDEGEADTAPSAATEASQSEPSPPRKPTELPCLEQAEHWSRVPKLGPGVELAFSRYVVFETPEGEKLHARIFLLEIRPDRAPFPEDLPAETLERRRAVPARIACIGHEIAADAEFVPDYDVPKRYVKPIAGCDYELDLGALRCRVRTRGGEPGTN